jgi:hypothetical protein
MGPIGGLVEFHYLSHFGTPLRSHAGTSPRASKGEGVFIEQACEESFGNGADQREAQKSSWI